MTGPAHLFGCLSSLIAEPVSRSNPKEEGVVVVECSGSVGVGLGWWFWGGGSGGWFFGVFLEWVSEMVLGWFLREIIWGGFGVGL